MPIAKASEPFDDVSECDDRWRSFCREFRKSPLEEWLLWSTMAASDALCWTITAPFPCRDLWLGLPWLDTADSASNVDNEVWWRIGLTGFDLGGGWGWALRTGGFGALSL